MSQEALGAGAVEDGVPAGFRCSRRGRRRSGCGGGGGGGGGGGAVGGGWLCCHGLVRRADALCDDTRLEMHQRQSQEKLEVGSLHSSDARSSTCVTQVVPRHVRLQSRVTEGDGDSADVERDGAIASIGRVQRRPNSKGG